MRYIVTVAASACAILGVAAGASAQTRHWLVPDAVTPFHSSQRELGDSQGMGAAVQWSLTPKLALEAETEFRSGRLDTLKGLTANVVAELPRLGRVTPFVVGGAGIDDYRWNLYLPHGSFGRTELNFAVNAGAGVRVHLTGAWSARVDVRWSDGMAEQAKPVTRVLYGVTLGLGER
jgi:opacity protein-like surface antigen